MIDDENILKFGGHRLWRLRGKSDIALVEKMLQEGKADGVSVSKIGGYKEADLECLTRISNLRILAINDLPGIDISSIGALNQLEYLSLDGEGPVRLNNLKNLIHLRLNLKEIELPTDGLPSIQHLAIWNFKEKDFSFLGKYSLLTELEIIQTRTLGSLEGIEHCKELMQLTIAYAPALLDIGKLSCLNKLVKVDFENIKKLTDYSALARLVALQTLIIEKCGPLKDAGFIRGLSELRHLVIRSTPILDRDLSPLKALPLLSHVYLDKKKEYEPTLSEIKLLVQARKDER